MRKLLYIPIIHTSEDIGSLSKAVTERGISHLGEKVWSEHVATVHKFWDSIADYCASLPASGMKIYQDGLVADGEMGAKIVAASALSGSRNYQIVELLRQRGSEIVKTEDIKLVLEERDRLVATVQARTLVAKIIAVIKYRLIKNKLLDRRDQFIANRIAETLADGRTGILFVGAYHLVRPKLPADIQVVEVKKTELLREYQTILPFSRHRHQRFAELGRYLAAPVELDLGGPAIGVAGARV